MTKDINSDRSSFSGITPEEVELRLAEALIRLASQGSVHAATEALKIVTQRRIAAAKAKHRDKMKQCENNNLLLAEYLGELGENRLTAQDYLGRPLTVDEIEHLEKGAHKRSMEMRALELDSSRSGDSKIMPWMTRTD